MSRPRFFISFLVLLYLLVPSFAHGTGKHEYESEHDGPMKSGPLILVKIGCLVVIFVLTFISGLSPYFLKWSEGFLVLGTQFAGGVFLGTALMHFLSDASESFEDVVKGEASSYPFAFMLACAGYLFTMLADCVVAHVYNKGGHHHQQHNDLELQGGTQHKTNQNSASSTLSVPAPSIGVINPQSSSHVPTAATATSLGDSILLITALCFHSVFEGIAIGISETESDAWRALWTITLHKIFAAIAMAIALLRMIPDRPLLSSVAYSFAFAISSPVGVALGIVIDATTQGPVADWIFAVSMSLACGVFVYVSINHLLAKGYLPNKKVNVDEPRYKFAAVLLGVGVIAIVMIWDT